MLEMGPLKFTDRIKVIKVKLPYSFCTTNVYMNENMD